MSDRRTSVRASGGGLGGVVSGGVVWVTGLLDADRLPAESIAYTVQVVVRSGISFVIVKVVFGGSTLKQPRPSFCTQYHQVPESVEAFHANEMLVSELAVMRGRSASSAPRRSPVVVAAAVAVVGVVASSPQQPRRRRA